MSKVIIGIHGLGNKPPKNLLKEWWLQSINEGLQKLTTANHHFDFELVYWADIFNKEPLLPVESNVKNSEFQKEKYVPEVTTLPEESPGFRKKAVEYLEKYYEKIIVDEVMSLEHPSLTNFFIHYNMRELEAYYSHEDYYYQGEKKLIKEVLIARLTDVLKKHGHNQILLVAHSMGSMISHDALIDNPQITLDSLVTIGSPLGHKYVTSKLESSDKNNSDGRLKVPENIRKSWFNLSDPEDKVALVPTLSDIYAANSSGIKVSDIQVKNTYINGGDRNPHKSYGYLRTIEFARIVNEFLQPEKRKFLSVIKNFFR